MEPNATYSSLTANMIFDPEVAARGSRRADLRRDVHLFVPTLNGELDPAEAVKKIKDELE